MRSKPVIGISAGPASERLAYGLIERYRITADYAKAVLEAGGVPIVIPPQDDNDSELLELVDGVILSGGADLDPALYGDADRHPQTYDVHELRDRFELSLLRKAVALNMPVLCICRGLQLLNVAFGGSLIQHISDQVDNPLQHRQQELSILASSASHRVNLLPGSVTARIFGESSIEVNSLHHQSVRSIAPSLSVDGRAPDGVIEAASFPDRAFVCGVQWHPELMYKNHPAQLRPFESLVAAAVGRMAAGVR
jgi:putative glutamine amidotransferase